MSDSKLHCTNGTPAWFTGHWRDWHRGHGCDRDDGKTRSEDAMTEVAQHAAYTVSGFLTDAELRMLRASTTSGNDLLMRALDELTARRARDAHPRTVPVHTMKGPPGWRCECGASFDDYYALAEHVRLSIPCPRCGADADASIVVGVSCRWRCGHWIASNDVSAAIRDKEEEPC
jgi:hypothetical protein